MAKTRKDAYANHRSYDGTPVLEGQVLVPVWFSAQLKKDLDTAIDDNFTTWKFCGIHFLIGFTQIAEENFDSYMEYFWKEINTYIAKNRSGRCIIGYRNDGSPKLCPKANHCTHCPEKGLHPRYNPQLDTIPLSFSADVADYEGEETDYPDPHQMDPVEEASMEDVFLDLVEHLRSINPRYADIVTLLLDGFSPKEIIEQLHLKSSRGYQEISEAEKLTREYWHMHKRK